MSSGSGQSSLGLYLKGEKNKEYSWLHFIGTPDTKMIVENTRDITQRLLNIRQEWGRREEVTMEILPWYKQFADESAISTLEKRVRGKHVYLFSDPHGDFNSKRKLEAKIIEEIRSWLKPDDKGNISVDMLDTFLKAWWNNIGELVSLARSLNDKVANDLFTLEAIQSNGAETTNLVMLAMAFGRQDRPTSGKRQPHTFDLVWRWISNMTRSKGYVIDLDLHNPASESALQWTQFINLYTGWFIEKCLESMQKDKANIRLSSADQWGDKKIEWIAKDKKLWHITVIKTRDYSKENTVKWTKFIGDIKWKDILIHDDIIDTGGTLCSLLEQMLERQPKSINIAITHWMFHGKAYERLQKVIENSNGIIEKVYVTNSINKENLPEYVTQIDTSNILANTIMGVHTREGVNRDDDTDYFKIVSES